MCAEACAVYTMKKVRQTVYLSMHVMCSLLCDTRLYKPFTQLMIHVNLHNKYMNKKGVELALKVFEADEDHDNLELGTLREISVRTWLSSRRLHLKLASSQPQLPFVHLYRFYAYYVNKMRIPILSN